MKPTLLVLHAVVVLAVASLCAFELWRAIELYGAEYQALTYARALTAILCGVYAASHMTLLVKRRVTTQALVLFYPLSLALALTSSWAAHGYGKHWAPADTAEALRATIVGFGVVGLLSLLAAFSCYRAFASRA